MAILKTKARKKLKAKAFGLPKERKYPMPDKIHAINAKARAKQMMNKGKLGKSEYDEIVRKANKKLYGKATLKDPKGAKTGLKYGPEKNRKKDDKEYGLKFKGRNVKVRRT